MKFIFTLVCGKAEPFGSTSFVGEFSFGGISAKSTSLPFEFEYKISWYYREGKKIDKREEMTVTFSSKKISCGRATASSMATIFFCVATTVSSAPIDSGTLLTSVVGFSTTCFSFIHYGTWSTLVGEVG